jgi:bla regulator protein BlaR1
MNIFLIELAELFHWTVRASGYAVVLIALIVLAQMLLRSRLSAGWICALWLILLVRLALPVGPSSSLSLWNLLPKTVHDQSKGSSEAGGDAGVRPTAGESLQDKSNPGIPATQAGSIFRISGKALPLLWFSGALIMFGAISLKNLRLWLQVRKLRQVTDQPLLELLEDCKQAMGIRTIIGLVLTGQVQSPALFGFLRPRILLPEQLAEKTSREELRCIFLHELAHLKRSDIWIAWLTALMQSLHWFNPLIWWAFEQMRADREAAADALALGRMRNGDSDRYADTIVNLLENIAQSSRLPVVAGIVENKTQIKRRLTMITRFKPPKRLEAIFAAILMAILAMATLTEAQDVVIPVESQIVGHSVPFTPAYVLAKKLRIGGQIMASKLVYKTEPVYPENAKAAGIAGETEFEVTIDGNGDVIDVWSQNGNPLLADAGADAIRQWRYTPVLMNGSPTSVSFTVAINFLPDGSVATLYEAKTKAPENEFLNIPIPSILNNEMQDSGFLSKANTGYRTFEGRRYLLIGQGMTPAVVEIDRQKLRELANAGWPAESDQSKDWVAPMVVRVFINKNGGIEGIAQEYGPKIPAINDMLMHLRVLSPAMFGAEAVPSHIRFEIAPPQGIGGKQIKFALPTFTPDPRPANP